MIARHGRWFTFVALVLSLPLCAQTPMGTGFTYQGELSTGGSPANGTFDLRFTLYDQATGGSPVSAVACAEDVAVADGRFTVLLPFTVPGNGLATYLEVEVRSNFALPCPNVSEFTTLSPRQAITPAPVATFAQAVTATAPTIRGAIRFRPETGQFEGFDGLFWIPFQVGAPLAPTNTQVFSTSGTHQFVVPPGVHTIGVEVWSGGGGGGDRVTSFVATSCESTVGAGGAGGGGSGGYVRASIDVTPGETLEVRVGSGGLPGMLNGPGFTGGASSVIRGQTTLVRVSGGSGGAPGVPNMNVVLNCPGSLAGAGGAGGTVGTVLGTVVTQSVGRTGGRGSGPCCNIAPPTPGFCQGTGGAGGTVILAGVPLLPVGFGQGGRGWGPPSTAQSAGLPGGVRFFWN